MLTPRQRRQHERQVYLQELVTWRMSEHKIAELLEVDVATVKRWLTGATRVPRMAIIALEAYDGRLPGMDQWRQWEGAKISPLDGLLYTPWSRRGFHCGEVGSIPRLENIAELQRAELVALRAEVERLREAGNTAANDALAWKDGWPEPLPLPPMDVTPRKRRRAQS